MIIDDDEIFMMLDRHPDEVKKEGDLDDLEEFGGDSEEGDEDEYDADGNSRIYQIRVAPKSKLYFDITYSPKSFDNYNFLLPLIIKGYHQIPALTRNVKCSGKQ